MIFLLSLSSTNNWPPRSLPSVTALPQQNPLNGRPAPSLPRPCPPAPLRAPSPRPRAVHSLSLSLSRDRYDASTERCFFSVAFVFSSRSLSQFGFALLFHDCNVQTGGTATSETHDSASSAGRCQVSFDCLLCF